MMSNKSITRIIVIIFLAIAALVALGMWGIPKYSVWQQGLAGEAELKRAEQNRKIRVQEAEAKKESSKLDAESEVIRAEGVAKANKIIGASLHDNEAYLRYLWIIDVAGANVGKTVVYIPTEANLPILEAGRFGPPSKK